MNKVIFLSCMAVFATGCEVNKMDSKPIGMANPASQYCIKIGGTLDIVKSDKGEMGMCHLADGTVIEEWQLFRSQNQS